MLPGATMSRLFTMLSIAALSGLAACDAQVDSEHQGEVLATIHGDLQSMRVSPLEEPEVAVAWAKASVMGGIVGAERVAAEGLFPKFTLSIYSPPPDEMLDGVDVYADHPPDDGKFAVGYIVVGTAATDYARYQGWRGVDLHHLLVYLPQDIAAGGALAAWLGGPAT